MENWDTSRQTRQREHLAEDAQSGKSLGEQAYERIEDMIVTLKLAPGSAVSEIALSRQLGMSRTPVGEALQRLAREGLVVILPRRGIIVSDVNPKQQLHLLEIRREVDRFVARTAARRATQEERDHFRSLAKSFEEAADAGDENLLMRADRIFHPLFAVCTRNEFATSVVDLTEGLSRRFWFAHRKREADIRELGRLHARVALAVASGDEQAAAAASDQLVDYAEAFARSTLSLDV